MTIPDGPFRILCVESELRFAARLKSSLERAGFRCRCADNAEHAVQALRDFMPDLILLNNRYADGSGLELCRRIRRENRFACVVIAVFAGSRDDLMNDGWLEAGADTCWQKTSAPARVVALVKGLVGRLKRVERGLPVPGLLIDPVRRVITYNGIGSTRLSLREALFMDLLCRVYPKTLERCEITRKLFPASEADAPDLALNAFVRRLKRKLPRPIAGGIEADYRRGYRLRLAGTRQDYDASHHRHLD